MIDKKIDGKYEYFAFISYKEEDAKWAKWLQRKLEHYKLPTALRKENPNLPERISPIYEYKSEAGGGRLKNVIWQGLTSSKYLIVICSPRATKSEWLNNGIRHFVESGQEENIIPFIIEGTPKADNPDEECFPSELRKLTGDRELRGININEMGRDAAVVKVVSRMFDVKFDSLWQRYEREQKKNRWMIIGGAVLFALVSLGIGIYFMRQNQIIANQKEQLQSDSVVMASHLIRIQNDSLKLSNKNDSITLQNQYILQQKEELDKTNHELELSNRQLAESQEKLLNKNILLAQANQKAQRERDEALIQQSRYIAKEAIELFEDGYTIKSLLLMRQLDSISRPYTNEYENVLRTIFDKRDFIPYKSIALSNYVSPPQVYSSAFSKDGKLFAVSMADSTVYILNAISWKVINKLKFKNNVFGLCFTEDNNKILIGTYKESGLYDIKAHQKNVPFIMENEDEVICDVKYSSALKYVAIISTRPYLNEGKCSLWNAATLQLINRIDIPNEKIRSIDFSPDGSKLAMALSDSTSILWDLTSKKEIQHMKGHRHVISSIRYSPDGKYVVTTSWDHTARIWDVRTGNQIALLRHNCFVSNASFSPDGKYLVTSDIYSNVRLWDTNTWYNILDLEGAFWKTWSNRFGNLASFTPDGNFIVTGSCNKRENVRIWSIKDSNKMTILKCDYKMHDAFYSHDASMFITTSDENVCIWNNKNKEQIKEFRNEEGTFRFASMRPDEKQLAILLKCTKKSYSQEFPEYKILLIDMSNFKINFEIPCNKTSYSKICYSPDSRYIYMGTNSGNLLCWDTTSGLENHNREMNFDGEIRSIAFSEDGRYMAVGMDNRLINMYDDMMKENWKLQTDKGNVTSLLFVNGSKELLSYDGEYMLFDIKKRNMLGKFSGRDMSNISLSPNGEYTLSSGNNYDTVFSQWGEFLDICSLDGDKTGHISFYTGKIGSGGFNIMGASFSPNKEEIMVVMKDGNILFINTPPLDKLKKIMYHTLNKEKLTNEELKKYYLK